MWHACRVFSIFLSRTVRLECGCDSGSLGGLFQTSHSLAAIFQQGDPEGIPRLECAERPQHVVGVLLGLEPTGHTQKS